MLLHLYVRELHYVWLLMCCGMSEDEKKTHMNVEGLRGWNLADVVNWLPLHLSQSLANVLSCTLEAGKSNTPFPRLAYIA